MKHVISIGVDNVSGLTPLKAAASGARRFDQWALSQGYFTTLFTDENNRKVTSVEIFNEVRRIVDERTCEHLIIFFAGHGLLLSPSQEVWLLSEAGVNPNESINLTASIENARTTGIPYIVFISDACRALPVELHLTRAGSEIFPIYTNNDEDCGIDVLYATRAGAVANEVSSQINAERFGLFTRALVEILEGQYPEVIFAARTDQAPISLSVYNDPINARIFDGFQPKDWSIKTPDFKLYIKSLVQRKASEIKVTLQQNPEIRLEDFQPKPPLSVFNVNVARQLSNSALKKVSSKKRDEQVFNTVAQNLPVVMDHIKAIDGEGSQGKSKIPRRAGFRILLDQAGYETFGDRRKTRSGLIGAAGRIFDSRGTQELSIKTGLTIIGQKIDYILVQGGLAESWQQYGALQVRIKEHSGVTALIVLPDGTSIPVAIMKGYIGTLVFDKGRLLTINYTPSPSYNVDRYKVYLDREMEIKFVRAFVASAANEGFDYGKVFNREFDEYNQWNYGDPGTLLRRQKAADPSLGIYASYAYVQSGQANDAESVYQYMRFDNETMPFDVSMLANHTREDQQIFAPFCPMLSLGWAYRRRFEAFLFPEVREASNFLVPNLWTTFDKDGTSILSRLF